MMDNKGKQGVTPKLDQIIAKQHQRGFTLLELLIVVVIIGILAAIAYPGYQRYVNDTHRTAAKGQMADLAQALERYRSQNFSYAAASNHLSTLAPDLVNNEFYNASLTVSADNQSYEIVATPQKVLAGDGTLKLNSNGDSCYSKGAVCTITNGSSW